MERVLEWAVRHPLLVLVLAIGAFVLWLAAPITWRDGEGTVTESGENVRDWASFWGTWSGSLPFWIISRGVRK